MASPREIADVRYNVDERDQERFTDEVIEELIDAHGVNSASAVLWRRKAALYAALVDESEAGASHKFSDLHKNALAMALTFEAAADSESVSGAGSGRAKVHVIERPRAS